MSVVLDRLADVATAADAYRAAHQARSDFLASHSQQRPWTSDEWDRHRQLRMAETAAERALIAAALSPEAVRTAPGDPPAGTLTAPGRGETSPL